MVRALFTTLLKANRQKEAKALTTKYGASKLTELKAEDYAAVYKEASELLEKAALEEGIA
jgi:predicted metalloprotease